MEDRYFSSILRMGKLDSIDVTNFIFQKQFCEINFDGNPIESITNPTAFKIDKAKEYGLDGTISVKNCRLYQMMNLTDIGLDQPSEFYKYLKFSFDARDSNFACDCILAPILASELDRAQKFWVQLTEGYDNVTCMSPEKLKGVTVKYLVESGDLDGMICDEPEHCPKGCDCYSQPSQNHLVINCTDAGLQTLPETLPWGNRYTLLMEGNDINSLDERDYLKRVYMADFRNNPVKTLATDAVSTFPDDVQLTVDGDGLSQFTTEIKIDQLDQELLNCDPIDKLWQRLAVVVAVIISIVLGLAMIFLCFKPEIFLLYRHHILCRKHDFDNLYDVYICFDERKQLVRKWIFGRLSPYLEGNGYQVFLPCRDESLGESRVQIREHAINNSRAYVVVVSNGAFDSTRVEEDSLYSFADDLTIQMEFSNILDNFKSDSKKRIAVINFRQSENQSS
ncbi:hypothetical protein FSP39_008945 [Pinctada imbricata]|uniref:TIR domain-containing protein n=1 Tax=Pinctada imbricata TaxID=66713 RepID=A0AA89C166_PINIB|nr:hypothetical protein FSP39_008945 [Pinctada imbricata]